MTWKSGVLLACGLLAACDDEPRRFAEFRAYTHEIFETPEECAAAQPPDLFFNCTQDVQFFPDGTVLLMLTDILNSGTYEIDDDRILLDFEANSSEVPGWRFSIEDDSLLLDDYENEWRLIGSGTDDCLEVGWDAYACE